MLLRVVGRIKITHVEYSVRCQDVVKWNWLSYYSCCCQLWKRFGDQVRVTPQGLTCISAPREEGRSGADSPKGLLSDWR